MRSNKYDERNNSMLNMQKNKVAYNKYLTQYIRIKKYRDHRMTDDCGTRPQISYNFGRN